MILKLVDEEIAFVARKACGHEFHDTGIRIDAGKGLAVLFHEAAKQQAAGLEHGVSGGQGYRESGQGAGRDVGVSLR